MADCPEVPERQTAVCSLVCNVEAISLYERSSFLEPTLRPRSGLVNDREIARCLRHSRETLDVTAAAVLHCALTQPPQERVREALRSPVEHAAAERLIAAGLLDDDRGVLRPTLRAEATFRAPPDRRHLC